VAHAGRGDLGDGLGRHGDGQPHRFPVRATTQVPLPGFIHIRVITECRFFSASHSFRTGTGIAASSL
jgi:hypothetical protein